MNKHFAVGLTALLLASINAAAADSKAPSVSAIVDKYIEKIGGQSNLAKIKTRTITGEFIGENPVPWTEYTQDSKKRAWILEIPNAAPMSRVFDGEKGWAKEPDGTVKEMEGVELARHKLEAAFRHLMNPKGVFDLAYEKAEQQGGDTIHVLIAKQPGGGTDRLYFSDKTGLLVGVRADWDGGAYDENIEDYRTADGIQFPFTRKAKFNDFEFTLKIKELKQNTPIDPAVFGKPKAE